MTHHHLEIMEKAVDIRTGNMSKKLEGTIEPDKPPPHLGGHTWSVPSSCR
jgi:hypothetical protein